jgi:hypothetical protein
MVIAFAGAGLSELFRRRRLFVLAEPLERTGAFLPLLPVLGFWAFSSNVHYSGLMFVVGALYGTLAIMRRSFRLWRVRGDQRQRRSLVSAPSHRGLRLVAASAALAHSDRGLRACRRALEPRETSTTARSRRSATSA